MDTIFETIIKNVAYPNVDPNGNLQMQVSALSYSSYVGLIGTGRIRRGHLKKGQQVSIGSLNGEIRQGKVLQIMNFHGLEKQEVEFKSSDVLLDPNNEKDVNKLIAIALAEHIAGGEIAFADLMNQQAAELGMSNTEYMNSTGLPAEGMFTSARDLSTIARSIIRDHPKYYSIYAKKYFEHNNINQPNRNRLLWRDKSVDGLKTGKTDAAGYCLVASAKRRDMRLISVILGAKSDEVRAQESQRLLSYGFRYFDTQTVYSAGEILKSNAKLWYGVDEFLNCLLYTSDAADE